MRARIEEALRRCQYRPNENARNLRRRESRTIGLLVPDLTNSFYARMMRGAEDCLASLGYRLVVADSREDRQRQRDYLISFAGRRTDGILLAPCWASDELVDKIPSLIGNLPLVYVDRSPLHAASASVLPDNEQAGYDATRHLLELGHKRIGIISEPLSLPAGEDRLTGYKRALRAAGVRIDRDQITIGADTQESGYWCGLTLLDQHPRLTAIVVCNNLMTLGLLAALREKGLTCPGDLSIVGFDDFEWCPHISPALSMISVPAAELGSAAAKMLMKRIRSGHSDSETVLLKTELVLRASTSRPS